MIYVVKITQVFELSGGTPSGGIYSGSGVSNAIFSPINAGVGTHNITYTYTLGPCGGN